MKIEITDDEAVMLCWLLDALPYRGEPFKDFEDDTGRDDIDPEKLAVAVLEKLPKPKAVAK